MTSAKPARIIVNIVGLPGSGKSSVCAHLTTSQGFELYRPSDTLREYARVHNRPLASRQDYVNCHAAMNTEDPNAMIQPVIDSKARLICIDGLRAPKPMRKLQELYGAICIALECPIEKRFANIRADKNRFGHRSKDTLEKFREDELPDYHNNDTNLPSMDDLFAMATYHVDASKPLDQVCQEVDEIISSLQAH